MMNQPAYLLGDFSRFLSGLSTKFAGTFRENENLAQHVYYRIGGSADLWVRPQNIADLKIVFDFVKKSHLPYFILGSGTNILVDDHGFRGVIIAMAADPGAIFSQADDDTQSVVWDVPAVMPKSRLLELAFKNKLSGLEFSAGIPGTMGGAVFMNAGTKWGSYADCIEDVTLVHPEHGESNKTREQMGFRYRGLGEGVLDGRTVVESVRVRLRKIGDRAGSLRLIDEILAYRGERQPLERPNCGSVFKNPPPDANSQGRGAGRLIEAAGLKGRRLGNAMVSTQHANFIWNMGDARAADVAQLIAEIQSEVHRRFGVQLEREVVYLGRE